MSETHFIQNAINKEKTFRDNMISSLYTLFDNPLMTKQYTSQIRRSQNEKT